MIFFPEGCGGDIPQTRMTTLTIVENLNTTGKENQIHITGMDNQILSLYAKGMTTREIATEFKELYDADVSPTLISKVTDVVMEQVVEWQNRPLGTVYPIVYLDCIVLKIWQDSHVINKSVFLALGINIEGQKELLGM